MRVEGLMVLHYGLDYLPWAIRSVLDHVDRFHVVYAESPSHGFQAGTPCPESRQQLLDSVSHLPKVQWHDVGFRHEGQHRDWALAQCHSDLALVVDADEVWDLDVLERALKHAWDGSVQTWRLNFTTPWRSFNWVVRDNMWPDRIHDKRHSRIQRWGYLPKDFGEVHHFGYAVTDEVMSYKIKCHGHKPEWRADWFDEKWSAWPPVDDVHPTCDDTWHPEPYDRELLPALMREHPFWDKEMIK